MSLFGALYTGVSGLLAQSQALGIISNNIANVNTVGYKEDNAQFSDLVASANIGSIYNPGGVSVATEQSLDQQGAPQQTSSSTDLALSGNGLFVVTQNPKANSVEPFYTRAGSFTTDSNGYLKNAAGYYLMGWKLDNAGNLPPGSESVSTTQPVNVNLLSSILQQTTTAQVSLNLDARLPASSTGAGGSVPSAGVTPDFSRTLPVIDSLGTSQTLTTNYTKNYSNAWTVQVTGGGPGYPYQFGVLFSTSGAIQAAGAIVAGAPASSAGVTSGTAGTTYASSIAGNVLTVVRTVDPGSGATAITTTNYTYGSAPVASTVNPVNIALPAFNFGDGSSTSQVVNLDVSQIGQSASANNVNFVNQDGVSFGTRTGVTVDASGDVSINFSNGQSKKVYQLPIATFVNPNGLQASSGEVYSQTEQSGTYNLQAAGTVNAGTITPSALENSNVDLADQFSKMIITQRAYSANTKIISTVNTMLSDLLQIQT